MGGCRMSNGARYDLVVSGGTLVIPGVGSVRSDVGISGDKIVALADDLSGRAKEVYDARDRMRISATSALMTKKPQPKRARPYSAA
jgi:hypothetical protein